MKKLVVARICVGGIIAALYAALCLFFPALSYGPVQFRLSEAMTLLPAVCPEAVPGLVLGCLISNLFSPLGINVYDVVFGTLATLIAALISGRCKKNLWKAALPPVIANGIIIGLVLTYAYHIDVLWMNMLTVAAGEAAVCFVLGIPLAKGVQQYIGSSHHRSLTR